LGVYRVRRGHGRIEVARDVVGRRSALLERADRLLNASK
jgi:hypothetical protein